MPKRFRVEGLGAFDTKATGLGGIASDICDAWYDMACKALFEESRECAESRWRFLTCCSL